MGTRNTFADNLKLALMRRDVSQVELAECTGVSKATVSYWCNGKSYPRPDKMQMIADKLNVTMSWLTTGRMNEMDFVLPRTPHKYASSDMVAELYDRLDEHGQEVVTAVIDIELKRMGVS